MDNDENDIVVDDTTERRQHRKENQNFGATELNNPTYEGGEYTRCNSNSNLIDTTKKLDVIMSAASHCLITAFTLYITYLSFQNHVLFSWHPTCMTIGAFFLMAEAIMAMSPNNFLAGKLQRQGRIRMHFVIQACAAAFMFAGFLVIFVNKNLHNKNHFQTWHSITGLITVVLVAVTASGGISALYALRLKKWVKPSLIKFIHNLVGILTFVLGVITLILGLFSNWFYKNGSYSAQVICTIVIGMAAIFALESSIKSGYSRFKGLFYPVTGAKK